MQGRRTLRERKVAQRIAVVDESTRKKAAQERLDAYEADNEGEEAGAAGSDDDDFVLAGQGDSDEDEEVEVSGKRKKTRSSSASVKKRKTRTSAAAPSQRKIKNFQQLLEDSGLQQSATEGGPNYLTAAVGPSTTSKPRKFCSVCGNISTYKCSRCGSLYCSRRCQNTHTETRCLKMIS